MKEIDDKAHLDAKKRKAKKHLDKVKEAVDSFDLSRYDEITTKFVKGQGQLDKDEINELISMVDDLITGIIGVTQLD